VVSPVLIIRKVERDTTVVGGGLQEGAKGVPDHFCALGEVCGDPVSQLHKVAFEVYDPNKPAPAPGSAGSTGAFLSCMGDKVNTYRPSEGRTWNYSEMSSRSQSPAVPDSPGGSSNGSMTDYFSNGSPLDGSSMDGHGLPPSSDGGRVNNRRGAKRSNTASSGPIQKTTSKARRRVNSVGSNGSGGGGYASSSTRYGIADQSMASGALWSIDIGESAVWTIVGTGQSIGLDCQGAYQMCRANPLQFLCSSWHAWCSGVGSPAQTSDTVPQHWYDAHHPFSTVFLKAFFFFSSEVSTA